MSQVPKTVEAILTGQHVTMQVTFVDCGDSEATAINGILAVIGSIGLTPYGALRVLEYLTQRSRDEVAIVTKTDAKSDLSNLAERIMREELARAKYSVSMQNQPQPIPQQQYMPSKDAMNAKTLMEVLTGKDL